jgi:serine/threonine protein kinase
MRSVFRERDLLFELDHPLIIKLLGVDMDDEFLYFIFEMCENGDLADLLGNRRLPPTLCRYYTAQIV